MSTSGLSKSGSRKCHGCERGDDGHTETVLGTEMLTRDIIMLYGWRGSNELCYGWYCASCFPREHPLPDQEADIWRPGEEAA